MFRFKVDESDLSKIDLFVSGALLARDDIDPLVTMLRVYGMFTNRQFASRGQEFGSRWQSISEYTRKVRQQRGLNALAPPLHGTGALKEMVGDRIEKWPLLQTSRTFTDMHKSMRTDPTSDGPTTLTVSITPGNATMHLVGPKASHMTGDSSGSFIGFSQYRKGGYSGFNPGRYGMGYMPPRPFWGMNAALGEALEEAAVAGFIRGWYNAAGAAGGTTRYSTPNMAYLRMIG